MKSWLFGFVFIVLIFAISLLIKSGGDISLVAPFLIMIPFGVIGAIVFTVLICLLPHFGGTNEELKEGYRQLENKVTGKQNKLQIKNTKKYLDARRRT